MKIYIVTAGEYSAYGICAVFDNLEDAQKYCAVHQDEDHKNCEDIDIDAVYEPFSIEEHDTDEDKVCAGDLYAGFVYKIYESGWDDVSEIMYSEHPFKKKVHTYEGSTYIQIPLSGFRGKRLTDDYLLKIGRDEYAKYLAEREGL